MASFLTNPLSETSLALKVSSGTNALNAQKVDIFGNFSFNTLLNTIQFGNLANLFAAPVFGMLSNLVDMSKSLVFSGLSEQLVSLNNFFLKN
jgi:hypothetical protein